MKMNTKHIEEIQWALTQYDIDGWLFYDFENRDEIAYKVLKLDPNKLTTRRWYYFIPSMGSPIKLVHSVESERLSELRGETKTYSSWSELHTNLAKMLSGHRRIAMQYSPYNDIPSISYVDAGTIELVRSFNIEVVSSADLIQRFTATIYDEGINLHKEAGEKVQNIKDLAFEFLFEAVVSGRRITEYDVQQFIVEQFTKNNLTSEGLLPLVAVNSHAANPHFEVTRENAFPIKRNDRILIDLWAKVNVPQGIYYDITWCGYLGSSPPDEYSTMFSVVVRARNLTKNFIIDRLNRREKVYGWEVDEICRSYISSQGYGNYFTHRTGHSIDTKVHGSGVNIDNYETKDRREIIPGVCFSIEPGIYKEDFGVRSEISLLVNHDRKVIVVGEEQEQLLLLR